MFLLPPLLCACASQSQLSASGPVEPGYYRVQAGDTLGKIAHRYRQSVRNLAAWNSLSNPDRIDTGQVLRVVPPDGSVASTAAPTTAAPATPAPAAVPRGTPVPASGIDLAWPARGPVLLGFNGTTNKGIDIGGQAGDPVVAAASGKVVYAGNGLRGYGNLIMLKHDGGFLTAYAHNRALLAKEGQSVRQGQEIAEMGSSDSNRVNLHFELRYQGKPLDPTKYLPAR